MHKVWQHLHSYSHPKLPHLTKQQIIKDTSKGIKIFKQHLGFEPKIYAYPYGEYNKKVQDILVENFNFEAILNQNIGSISKDTNQYDIPRIALVGKVNVNHKLRYKTLPLEWIEPKAYPKDGILKQIKAKVNPKIKIVKTKDKINRIAITTGSGMGLLEYIKADCFLTGDIKYHEAMEAKARGINLIDIEHFHSEKYFIDSLKLNGIFKGSFLGIKRILRCHPIKILGGKSGYDPARNLKKVKK